MVHSGTKIKSILFIFLDGVGLGEDDPSRNPFAVAEIPNLIALLGGRRPLAGLPRIESDRAVFIPTDPSLGVPGPPQSATGQAAILTGLNVPALIGKHWGPKPNAAVVEIVKRDNIFKTLGGRAALANAYPERYFAAIRSGRRNYSTVPLAVTSAGLPLFTAADLRAGRAFSADFTGAGWRADLKFTDTPLYTPREAGRKLAASAMERAFTFFEHWLTDYVGHRGTLAEAIRTVETFDAALGGVLEAWDDTRGLTVITSDHGNLEDMSMRHHSLNRVPTLVVGEARAAFAENLTDLTGFVPAIRKALAI
ncbi:MAG: metalloenzyme domain-containing protein [Chloroflexi bacterium]|nr:metalloenzyme domain-containing protein [Chloroflexota bacterium]